MPWPINLPPNNRTNATPLFDAHASDHNAIVNALNALTASGVITGAWRTDVPIQPGAAGTNIAFWSRVGQRVFIDTCLAIQGAGVVLGSGGTNIRMPLPPGLPISAAYSATGAGQGTQYSPRGSGAQGFLGTPALTAYTLSFSLGWQEQASGGVFVTGVSGAAWFMVNGSHFITNAYLVGQFSYLTDAP